MPLDPYRTDDPVVNGLFELVGDDTEVLDVGGGAGRLALPLATRARHVTVVDPSEDSVELLKSRMEEAGLTNVTVVNEPWEEADVPSADIVLCSLVLHHQLEVVSFVKRMEQHARDRVVVLEMMETPGAVYGPFQERVYGAAITPLPGIPKLLALLWEMGIFADVSMFSPVTPLLETDRDSVQDYMRRRLFVEEGTEKDERLQAAMEDLLEETPEGITVRGWSHGSREGPEGHRGLVAQGLFIIECHWSSSFVVSLSNHERATLRQAQDERMRARCPRSKCGCLLIWDRFVAQTPF